MSLCVSRYRNLSTLTNTTVYGAGIVTEILKIRWTGPEAGLAIVGIHIAALH